MLCPAAAAGIDIDIRAGEGGGAADVQEEGDQWVQEGLIELRRHFHRVSTGRRGGGGWRGGHALPVSVDERANAVVFWVAR